MSTNTSDQGSAQPDLRTVIRARNMIRTLKDLEEQTGLADFSAPEVAEQYGCSKAYARRELRYLVERGDAIVTREVGQAKLYRAVQDGDGP